MKQIGRLGMGIVLGKFLPPHQGHQLLIDFACAYAQEVIVLVGTLEREPIDGALRHQWVQQMCAKHGDRVKVVHLDDENPQYPEEDPDFWDIWTHSILSRCPRRPDYVFASEDYGTPLAQALGATYVPLDHARAMRPISATMIRQDPLEHWSWMPDVVRAHFLGRVCVFGPESTGKSTLSRALAEHYRTLCVPEYARGLIEAQAGHIELEDMARIVRGQHALEAALAPQARRMLFCDTDALTTTIWSQELFGTCDPWVLDQARARPADFTLLMDVDLPWEDDIVRYRPAHRRAFFERCKAALEAHGRPHQIIQGTGEARLRAAIAAVDAFFSQGHPRFEALRAYSTDPIIPSDSPE